MITFLFLLPILIIGTALVLWGSTHLKNLALDKLAPLADEKTLGEFDARYSEMPYRHAVSVSLYFVKAKIRVTDRRLVIAQKALFSSKYVMRHVLYFRAENKPENVGLIEDGYPSYPLDPAKVERTDYKGEPVLKLAPLKTDPTLPLYLLIKSSNLEQLRALMAPAPAPAGGRGPG